MNPIVMQIKNANYASLVNFLNSPITPETRKLVLERLTDMNNQLIASSRRPKEIDIDDILNDLTERDELDAKLDRIKRLHDKVVADKRRRRRDAESK